MQASTRQAVNTGDEDLARISNWLFSRGDPPISRLIPWEVMLWGDHLESLLCLAVAVEEDDRLADSPVGRVVIRVAEKVPGLPFLVLFLIHEGVIQSSHGAVSRERKQQ